MPDRNDLDLSLRHLRLLDVLMAEGSLTRAALVLDSSQPVLSKTLARLRTHFQDPLFVRVGHRMAPTPRAQELAGPIRQILGVSSALGREPALFEPKTTEREFGFYINDPGITRLLPAVMRRLQTEAPNLRLRAVQAEAHTVLAKMEAGEIDLALGAFPQLEGGVRRRTLFTDGYVCLVNRRHPCLGRPMDAASFAAERHVLVSSRTAGQMHLAAERILLDHLPARGIVLTVPGFVGAAMVVKQTDSILTLPARLGRFLASQLDLRTFDPPLALPEIEIALYWHERFDRDAGNRWMRALLNRTLPQLGDRKGRSAVAEDRSP